MYIIYTRLMDIKHRGSVSGYSEHVTKETTLKRAFLGYSEVGLNRAVDKYLEPWCKRIGRSLKTVVWGAVS